MHFSRSTRLPKGSNTARCLLLPRITLNQPYDGVLLEAYRVWYHSNRLKALRGKIRNFFPVVCFRKENRLSEASQLGSHAPECAVQ